MALTQQEIDQARNWINTQWSVPGSSIYGPAFDTSGSYDPSNRLRNYAVLGAGQAMGYDANDMSQILGQTAGDISAMGQQYQPQSNIWADIFRADNPMVGQNASPDAGTPSYSMEGNPYLGMIGSEMQRQTNNNLFRNIFPAIRSNAVGNGTVGGSREGVAQGIAIGDAQAGLTGALGNLYGNSYERGADRGLQRYGIDTNAALTNQGQQLGFYSTQRAQDMDQERLGADLYQLGTVGQWAPLTQANNIYGNYTGLGNTTTSGQQGGGVTGAIGGGLLGGSLAKQLNWWG